VGSGRSEKICTGPLEKAYELEIFTISRNDSVAE
jgi:hypothetical protein